LNHINYPGKTNIEWRIKINKVVECEEGKREMTIV